MLGHFASGDTVVVPIPPLQMRVDSFEQVGRRGVEFLPGEQLVVKNSLEKGFKITPHIALVALEPFDAPLHERERAQFFAFFFNVYNISIRHDFLQFLSLYTIPPHLVWRASEHLIMSLEIVNGESVLFVE